MKINVYIGMSGRDIRKLPGFEWLNEHRDCGDVVFLDASFPPAPGKSHSDIYDEMSEALHSCDVHAVLSAPLWIGEQERLLSYSADYELSISMYRRVPIIVIKAAPDDDAAGAMTLDDMDSEYGELMRIFDVSSGARLEDLPEFIIETVAGDYDEYQDSSLANVRLKKPYEGDEPYIFVSYSHKDRDTVYPIIARLQKDGYRLWYDEGIHAASQWDDYIASHIKDCGYMLAFISPNYIESSNCKDEISYARDLDKERLLVYLEKTKLPLGMAMRLKRLQAINRYEYKTVGEFYDKLASAQGMSAMKGRKRPDVTNE